jgi:hypothetical protein
MIFDSVQPSGVVAFVVGVVFLFKRVSEMDRFHELRVAFLIVTVISCLVFLYAYSFESAQPVQTEDDHFTLSEI